MKVSCKHCNGMHPGWECRHAGKESGEGERIGARAVHGFSGGDAVRLGVSAVSNKPSLDTNPAQAAKPLERITPSKAVEPDDSSKSPVIRSKPSRTAYFRQYMREYRARLKRAREGVNNPKALTG